MLSAWGLRKFLIRRPKPAVVRLTSGEKTEDLNVRPNASMSKLGETIAAVAPELVECFDSDGGLLRAIRPHIDNDPNDAPEPPKAIIDDPETARLTHFANLLARAYEHSTNVAFDRLVQIVERLEVRSENIEVRLERAEGQHRRLMNQTLQEAWDRAQDALEEAQEANEANGGGNLLEEMGRAFLGAQRQGTRERRTNGKGD